MSGKDNWVCHKSEDQLLTPCHFGFTRGLTLNVSLLLLEPSHNIRSWLFFLVYFPKDPIKCFYMPFSWAIVFILATIFYLFFQLQSWRNILFFNLDGVFAASASRGYLGDAKLWPLGIIKIPILKNIFISITLSNYCFFYFIGSFF